MVREVKTERSCDLLVSPAEFVLMIKDSIKSFQTQVASVSKSAILMSEEDTKGQIVEQSALISEKQSEVNEAQQAVPQHLPPLPSRESPNGDTPQSLEVVAPPCIQEKNISTPNTPSSSSPSSLLHLKEAGRAYLLAGSYRESIESYTRYLECESMTNEELSIVNLNIGICYSKLKQPREALLYID